MTTEITNEVKIQMMELVAQDDPKLTSLQQPGVRFVCGAGMAYEPRVMFIGEAPGPLENANGVPFSGGAGKILRKLLVANNFKPEDLWITNAVKYMPVKPGTLDFRTPTLEEIRAMVPYLAEEIALVKPKILCLLGNSAVSAFFTDERVGHLRHKNPIIYTVSENFPPFTIFVTYHPSTVQYDNTGTKLAILEADFKKLAELMHSM